MLMTCGAHRSPRPSHGSFMSKLPRQILQTAAKMSFTRAQFSLVPFSLCQLVTVTFRPRIGFKRSNRLGDFPRTPLWVKIAKVYDDVFAIFLFKYVLSVVL